MGGFSGLGEKLWGGNNNSAQKTTERQQEYSRRFTQQQMGQARSDTNTLYDRGDQARNYGYNQALDLYGQAMPIQANLYQSGNTAAQMAILGGQPQIYRAPQIDPSYFQQEQFRMPMYGSPELDYVPILNRSTGWNTQTPGNIGQQGVHPDQGLQGIGGMASVPSEAPTGNYQGRFGRWA